MRVSTSHCMLAMLTLCGSATAMAASASDDEAPNHWTLSAGAQVDDQSNSAYTARVMYQGTIDANWSITGSHSTASTDFSSITTDYGAFEFWHYGEHRGISFGAHWFSHDGVAQAFEGTMS